MQIARPVSRAIFLRLHSLVFCMQNTKVNNPRGVVDKNSVCASPDSTKTIV